MARARAGGGSIIVGCIDYFSHLALYQLWPGTYCVKVNEFKSIELNCAEDPVHHECKINKPVSFCGKKKRDTSVFNSVCTRRALHRTWTKPKHKIMVVKQKG
jgi:hypothetical protein